MKRLNILLPLIILAGCATPGTPMLLSEAQQEASRAAVIAVLKDPDSARFGPIGAARNGNGTTMVCGMVNARTSFGGYAGMAPFTGYFKNDGSAFVLNEVGTPDSYGVAMINACKARGIVLGS